MKILNRMFRLGCRHGMNGGSEPDVASIQSRRDQRLLRFGSAFHQEVLDGLVYSFLEAANFLPLFGPALYLTFGVNRLRRRAISLGVHKAIVRPIPGNLGEPLRSGVEPLEMLARVVGRVVGQPLTCGNRIQPLLNGDDAFPIMISAIESAKTSISLATYIFDNDPSGNEFVDALVMLLDAASPSEYSSMTPAAPTSSAALSTSSESPDMALCSRESSRVRTCP